MTDHTPLQLFPLAQYDTPAEHDAGAVAVEDGRLRPGRVHYSEPAWFVPATLADLECVHGVIGRCRLCARRPDHEGRSIIARGVSMNELVEAPATPADFECAHGVIGPCMECDLGLEGAEAA